MEHVEYLVTPEGTVTRTQSNEGMFTEGDIELTTGDSSNSGFKNTYMTVNQEIREKYREAVKYVPKIVNFVCKQVNEETGEERLKAYTGDDTFNVKTTMNMPECYVYGTSMYLEGPKDVVDFYFVPYNEEEYEAWLNQHGFEMLTLPDNAQQYLYAVKVNPFTQTLITHKRYGTDPYVSPFNQTAPHFFNPDKQVMTCINPDVGENG